MAMPDTFPLCIIDPGQDSAELYLYFNALNLELKKQKPQDFYLLSEGDIATGPITCNFNTIDSNQLVNIDYCSSVLDQSFTDLCKAGTTVTGNINLYNNRLTGANPVTVDYLNNLSNDWFPYSGNQVFVQNEGLIPDGLGPLNLHSQSMISYVNRDDCVPRFYVDNKCSDLVVTVIDSSHDFVLTTGGNSKYIGLKQEQSDWPDSDLAVVSKKFVNMYIDCMFKKLAGIGEIVVKQDIDKRVNTNSTLDIEFSLDYQSTGGGSCTGIDYPFSIIIDFVDAIGNKTWVHNFYYDQWGTVTEPHTKVCKGWNKYKLQLSNISETINKIKTIYLRASGIEFRTLIDRCNITVCDQLDTGSDGIIQLSQTVVSDDLECGQSLILSLDLNIIKQLEEDLPLRLIVYYKDENGQQTIVRNFSYIGQTIGENVKVDQNKWTHFELNLAEICPCVKNIYKVVVQGSGKDYEARIDNVKLGVEKIIDVTEAPTREPVKQQVATTTEPTDSKNSLQNLTSKSNSVNTTPLSNISSIPPVTQLERKAEQDVNIAPDKSVVLSADVKIMNQSSDSSQVPISIQVDYDSLNGPQTHTINISSLFDDNYYKALKSGNSVGSTDCSGSNYWQNPDCPGYKQLTGG